MTLSAIVPGSSRSVKTAIWRSLLPALLAWPDPLPAASRRCSVVQMGLIGGAGLHPASSSSVVACKIEELDFSYDLILETKTSILLLNTITNMFHSWTVITVITVKVSIADAW